MVREKIKTAIITGEKKMSSIKEYLMKEGYEQGFKRSAGHWLKQGKEKGIEQVALNMLKN